MNKLCKHYISDVKALFPIMQKPEKRYIKKLSDTIEEYCEETSITSMDAIYDSFGSPQDILTEYFSIADTPFLTKKIKISKWIKRGIITLIVITLIAVSTYCIKIYRTQKVFENEKMFSEEMGLNE
ncbi:MAG: hypothetical protein HFH14_07590 [Lachnospiraceae bacterium]|nr:hypothetical protein [Lachnospiraceae bacterium]